MIAEHFRAMAPQERRTLLAGAVLAVLLLGWALVWHPLAQRRAELRQQVERSRAELDYVRRGAAEIERLRAAGTRSLADRQGRSLLALADATARSSGLESALKRVEPAGAGLVRVSFEYANFDALVDWIDGLARGYGVQAPDFSADRADGVGLVNARVTLQDAP
jgi:general secretion pathway protein M